MGKDIILGSHHPGKKQDRSYLIVALWTLVHYCNGLSTDVKAIDNAPHCSDYAVINIERIVTHKFKIILITVNIYLVIKSFVPIRRETPSVAHTKAQ